MEVNGKHIWRWFDKKVSCISNVFFLIIYIYISLKKLAYLVTSLNLIPLPLDAESSAANDTSATDASGGGASDVSTSTDLGGAPAKQGKLIHNLLTRK